MQCPKCKCENVIIQNVQTGSIGAGTNKVVVEEAKRSKGCIYWMLIGWWYAPIKWLMFGWIKPLFGGKKRGGINLNASKTFNKTVATCQNCGHTWNV